MVYFQTDFPYLGKIWSALESKILSYFMTIWKFLLPFGINNGRLVYFVVIWYIWTKKNLATLVCSTSVRDKTHGSSSKRFLV
jgi:hypothetical protein